jgi:hypothetical protein
VESALQHERRNGFVIAILCVKNQFNQLIIDNLKVLNTSAQLFALGSINILQCEIQTFQE